MGGGRPAGLKLWRARSRLYQRRFLQQNTHFAAFFEIYKNCNPLHRSKLEKFRKFVNIFGDFSKDFCNFWMKICDFLVDFVDFHADFDRNFTNYRRISQNYQIFAECCEILWKFDTILANFLWKCLLVSSDTTHPSGSIPPINLAQVNKCWQPQDHLPDASQEDWLDRVHCRLNQGRWGPSL